MDVSLVDNKQQGRFARRTDTLDNYHLFLVTQLDKIRLGISFQFYYNLYRPNNTYLEASLIKVINILVTNTILDFGLFYKLESCANNLRIFLEYSSIVLCLVKYYFQLSSTRYKSYRLILTNRLSTLYSYQFIYYIFYFIQLGCKAS